MFRATMLASANGGQPAQAVTVAAVLDACEPAPPDLVEAVAGIPAVRVIAAQNSQEGPWFLGQGGPDYTEQLVAALAAEAHACRDGGSADALGAADAAVCELLRRLASSRHFKRHAENRRAILLLLVREVRRAYVAQMLLVIAHLSHAEVVSGHVVWIERVARRLDAAREQLASLAVVSDLEPTDELLALFTEELAAHELVDTLAHTARGYRSVVDELDKKASAAARAIAKAAGAAGGKGKAPLAGAAASAEDREAAEVLRALQLRGAQVLTACEAALKAARKRIADDATPAGSEVSAEAVNRAIGSHFRRHALQLHPDKQAQRPLAPGELPPSSERAQERFEAFREAQRVLTAPYDSSEQPATLTDEERARKGKLSDEARRAAEEKARLRQEERQPGSLRVHLIRHLLDAAGAPGGDTEQAARLYLRQRGLLGPDDGRKKPVVARMAEAGATTVGATPRAARVVGWRPSSHVAELRLLVPSRVLEAATAGGSSSTRGWVEVQLLYYRGLREWAQGDQLQLDDPHAVRRLPGAGVGGYGTHTEVAVSIDVSDWGAYKFRCARRADARGLLPARTGLPARSPRPFSLPRVHLSAQLAHRDEHRGRRAVRVALVGADRPGAPRPGHLHRRRARGAHARIAGRAAQPAARHDDGRHAHHRAAPRAAGGRGGLLRVGGAAAQVDHEGAQAREHARALRRARARRGPADGRGGGGHLDRAGRAL